MKKTQVSFYLATLMLAQVLMLGSTGLILEYVVGCGGGRHRGQGVGGETFLWMGRELWGDIHSTIAISLLAALAVHLVLHYKWLKCRLAELRAKPASKDDCSARRGG